MISYNPLPRPFPHLGFLPPYSFWLLNVGKDVVIIKPPLSALSSDWGDGKDLCRKQSLAADEVILKPSVVIYWLMKWRLALPSLTAICHFFGTYIKQHLAPLAVSVTVSRWLSKHSSTLANVKSPNFAWPSLKDITIELVLQYSNSNFSPSGCVLAVKDKITQNTQQIQVKLDFIAELIDWGSDATQKVKSCVTSPSLLLSCTAIHRPWLWILSFFSFFFFCFFNACSFLLMSEIKIIVLEILQSTCGNPSSILLVESIWFQVHPIDLLPHTLAAIFCLETEERRII